MRLAAAALLAPLVLAPAVASAVDYVNDPLTASSFAGRGSKGGTFSSSGWITVNEPDAVWWEIADALPSGRIEYTVTGLSVGGTLSGVDHDILVFYQAPTGKAEPIPYSPYFRNNDFKAMTRIFGTKELSRPGAMKLELAFCSRGDPWYHDTACPSGCDGSGIAYARGSDKDVGWDPSKSYRMAVEWSAGKMSFSRDGEVLGTVTYPGTYAPQPLRVRLGSPRHDGIYPGEAFMPKGITFRDVRISGTPGTRTPVCNAPVDMGVVVDAAPADLSVVMTDLGPSSDVAVLQDATAASWESGVFPDEGDLNIEASLAAVPTAVAYLKFPPIPNGAAKAILRLHTQAYPSAAGGGGEVCVVTDDSWQEKTITWANRPNALGPCTGGEKGVEPDREVTWDVTALLSAPAPGNRNLAIVSHDQNGAHYLSKESGGTNRGPRLSVVHRPAAPPDAAVAADAAALGDIAVARDGASDIGPGDMVLEGGCACRVDRHPGSPSALAALLLAAAIVVPARARRRQRR